MQRSSLLFGGQNLFNSLPRYLFYTEHGSQLIRIFHGHPVVNDLSTRILASTIFFFLRFFGSLPFIIKDNNFPFLQVQYSMDPIFPAACRAAAAAAGCYLSSAPPLHFCCCYSAPIALLLLIPLLQL